jgi:hypothetical protein
MTHGRRNHRKNEPAHQRQCLVRWICNLPSLNQRRNFLDKFQKRHGVAVADSIKSQVQAEWARRTYGKAS